MIFALLMSVASADDPSAEQEIWMQLNEGRVLAAIEEDAFEAIEHYNALLNGLSDSAAVYFELHYWLGRAYARAGKYTQARKSLEISSGNESLKSRATAFLFAMNRWEKRVQTIPYEGRPWIDESGSMEPDESKRYSAAFEFVQKGIKEIVVNVDVDSPMTLRTDIRDWHGKSHRSQFQLKDGQHLISIPLSEAKMPIVSLDVYALDSKDRNSVFRIKELIIK